MILPKSNKIFSSNYLTLTVRRSLDLSFYNGHTGEELSYSLITLYQIQEKIIIRNS